MALLTSPTSDCGKKWLQMCGGQFQPSTEILLEKWNKYSLTSIYAAFKYVTMTPMNESLLETEAEGRV